MEDRETWTTDEFGASHEGWVEVLLDDGSVPPPAFFNTGLGLCVYETSHWSVYDGRYRPIPRAAALRAACACGWRGPEYRLDWAAIGEQDLGAAGADQADTCSGDWEGHAEAIEATTIPLPETVTSLLEQLEAEIDKLGNSSPLAAVRAARRTEVTARQAGYLAARNARHDAAPGRAAAALGLDEDRARAELARLGRWNPSYM
ncbi:hypothetical protein [Streptomyces sp. NPDC057686]|uniref:hypothetical protein n=1 Tax=Streptomyces sp. NPDC057686 TaxID=3346212 RepID=UPI00368E0FE6